MSVIRFYGGSPFSNFAPVPIEVDGKLWPSTEHYYQAMKTLDPAMQESIRSMRTPGRAKRAGRMVDLRPDWEEIKEEVMLKALRVKFSIPTLRRALLSTGDALLEEDSPDDMYWGRRGKNRLGALLMQVRDEIRAEGAERYPQ